ncbi:MAG: TonB-dependent receptor [Rhodospirillaceae bacterium]|nr:TonB-dependent receptor [Rhodospirillaceae bacterium]
MIHKQLKKLLLVASAPIALTTFTQSQACAADQTAAAAASAAPAGGIEEIVVTATKQETNLQETPIAISVMSPTALQDRHVQSLLNLADGMPSLRVATFEARQSALTVGIRGIVPFDANQTARDQGVGVYIDGIYLGRQQGLNAALFDVERIEVLRGPQGTLFGRNTEGGAVSIVTKGPSGEFGGRVSASYGNYGAYDSQLHLDLPAFGKFAVKLDGVIQHQKATVYNPLPGEYGWGYYHRVGGRISGKWDPTDDLSILFTHDASKDENTPFFSQLIDYNPLGRVVGAYNGTTLVTPGTTTACPTCIAPLSPLVKVFGHTRQKVAEVGIPQQPSTDETDGSSITAKYNAADWIELRSMTAWRSVTTAQWDGSATAHRAAFVPNGRFGRYSLSDLHQTQFSQEFQAVGSIDSVDYAAGLYYFTERAWESAATPNPLQWDATGANYTVASPVVNGAITSGNNGWAYGYRFLQRASWANAHSYAAFANTTWHATDDLHVTLGGRITKDKRTGNLYTVSGVKTNYPFNFDKSRFDPKATIAYDLTDDINVYATYSTGYRAGGANARSSNFAAFGPETVNAYEIGAKTDLFDRRVRLNVAGYIMPRKGTQIDFDHVDTNATLPGTNIANPTFNLHTEDTANAPGTSKIRGLEVDLTTRPITGLTLGGSYAYTYTNIPLTPNPQLPGNPLTQVFVVFTPENAVSGFIDYEVPVDITDSGVLRFHIDANYSDPMYSFQSENVLTDSGFTVNANIALAGIQLNSLGQELKISLWSRNLFNEAHVYRRSNANNAILGAYGNLNPPRTVGLEASVKF